MSQERAHPSPRYFTNLAFCLNMHADLVNERTHGRYEDLVVLPDQAAFARGWFNGEGGSAFKHHNLSPRLFDGFELITSQNLNPDDFILMGDHPGDQPVWPGRCLLRASWHVPIDSRGRGVDARNMAVRPGEDPQSKGMAMTVQQAAALLTTVAAYLRSE
jgi:hypothetical protein